jgi:hypothetical protein
MSDEQAMEAFGYVSLVEPAIKADVAAAKARLAKQARPEVAAIPERQDIVETVTQHVSAGADKSKTPERRALTLVERQHLSGGLSFEEAQAGRILQQRFLSELGGSTGVGSYDPSSRPSPGWQRSDRQAVRILTRNYSNRAALSELLYAACGTIDDEGRRIFDKPLAAILVQAVTLTTGAITVGAIGEARSNYDGVKQRQAYGLATIRECLRRAAAHLGFVKLEAFSAENSWRVTRDVAR